jgi:hypothetical protein
MFREETPSNDTTQRQRWETPMALSSGILVSHEGPQVLKIIAVAVTSSDLQMNSQRKPSLSMTIWKMHIELGRHKRHKHCWGEF